MSGFVVQAGSFQSYPHVMYTVLSMCQYFNFIFASTLKIIFVLFIDIRPLHYCDIKLPRQPCT